MEGWVEARREEPQELSNDARRLWLSASEVMDVESVRMVDRGLETTVGRPVPQGEPGVEIRGRFLLGADQVFEQLGDRFKDLGYVLLLRKSGDRDVAIGIPGKLPRTAGNPLVAAVMFVVTVLSTLWVGSAYAGTPDDLLSGWPFTVSLLGILLAHEMGHYVMARRYGVPASLPYFIPFPTLLGTMGAVIQMTAPPRNRRSLLLLGAAGPLAGFVVAVPVLLIGLSQSNVQPISAVPGAFLEGNSLLYAAAKYLVFGQFLPGNGLDVFIGPVAFAGWAGLLVTGMNLLPAGQLDGGHIAYALLGKRARWLTWLVVGVLAALSLVWQGWLLFTALVLFFGRIHATPLDDVTQLSTSEKVIGFLALAVFVLVFIPIPITLY